jgi:hypothetical protein
VVHYRGGELIVKGTEIEPKSSKRAHLQPIAASSHGSPSTGQNLGATFTIYANPAGFYEVQVSDNRMAALAKICGVSREVLSPLTCTHATRREA